MTPQRPEKNDMPVKLWISESLYRDLQDLAAARDKSLSEYIRRGLECFVFGAHYKLTLARARQDARRR